MKKRSGRWSAATVLAVSLAMGCPLPLPPALGAEETPLSGAGESGRSAGDQVRERFGTQQKLRERIANPLTSSGTPMESLDGGEAFDAQLFFPSSSRFLELFVQPAGTGDLGTVLAGQDLDLDGSIDHSFQVPFAVSGVCANGLISCTPGTWQDCSFHLWAAEGDGRLALRPGSLFELGGCYCINNDCGNNLVWQNLPVVLRDLGGGAIGAVQRARPGFSVSQVAVGSATIAYYGQDTSRPTDPATGAASPAPPPTQTAYYRNPFALPDDAAAAAAGQAADPDSLYGRLSALSDAVSGSGQEATCTVTRVLQVTQETGFCQEQPAGTVLAETRERRFFKIAVAGGSYLIRGTMPPEEDIRKILAADPAYSFVSLKDYACYLAQARAVFDAMTPVPAEVRDGSSGPVTIAAAPPTGGVFLGRTIDYSYFDNDGSGCGGDDIGFSVFEWHEVCTRTADVAVEAVQNGCAGLEVDPDCALQWEKVDGVWTYRTFNPTGLSPLPSARTFAGLVPHEISRDWWQKERGYLCTDAPTPGFLEPLRRRYGHLAGSVTASGTDLYYQDLRETGSGWEMESGAIVLPEAEPVSPCEAACKTRRPKRDTQAIVAGHTAAAQIDPTSYDFFYRPCLQGGCPLEAGEEIVRDCQCLDDFPEAATIMQVLRQVGKDTICSDGVAKPLPSR